MTLYFANSANEQHLCIYHRGKEEGSKPLIEVIYKNSLWFPQSVCFQFLIRMVANLTPEKDTFGKVVIIISVLSMYSVYEGSGCEG